MTPSISTRELKEATLEDWAEEFWQVYSEKDAKRDLLQTWSMTVEHGTSLAAYLRLSAYDKSLKELTHVFCWILSFVNKLMRDSSVPARFKNAAVVSLSDILWLKYPQRCPFCLNRSCVCPLLGDYTALEPTTLDINTSLSQQGRPHSLRQWQSMFFNIYEAAHYKMSIAEMGFHFLEEIGEVQRSIRAIATLTGDQVPDIETLTEEQISKKSVVVKLQINLYTEIADVISWIFSLLQKYSSEIARIKPLLADYQQTGELYLDDWLWKEYGDPVTNQIRCPTCSKRPCTCNIHKWKLVSGD